MALMHFRSDVDQSYSSHTCQKDYSLVKMHVDKNYNVVQPNQCYCDPVIRSAPEVNSVAYFISTQLLKILVF